MMQPRLYVVDEPLANLDPATAERLLRSSASPRRRGPAPSSSSSTASRRRSSFGPTASCTWTRAAPRYLGDVDGFLAGRRSRGGQAAVRGRARPRPRRTARPSPVRAAARRTRQPAESRSTASARTASAALAPRVPRCRGGLRRRATSSAGSTPASGAARPLPCSGPNGSGKTTLFRTAMRLIEATAGSILVDGRPITRAHRAAACERLRLRLPESEPDALRADGPRGAGVRAAEPRPRPVDLRRHHRRRPRAGRRSTTSRTSGNGRR